MSFLQSRTSSRCFSCPACVTAIFNHCFSTQQSIHFLRASDSAMNNPAVDSFPACFRFSNRNNPAVDSFPTCFRFRGAYHNFLKIWEFPNRSQIFPKVPKSSQKFPKVPKSSKIGAIFLLFYFGGRIRITYHASENYF
jgi:hypothetical protein